MNECGAKSSLRWDLTTTAFVMMFFCCGAVAAAYALAPDSLNVPGAANIKVPVAVTVLAIALYAVHFLGVKLPVAAMHMNYDGVYRLVMITYAVAMATFLLLTNLTLFFMLSPVLLTDLLTLAVLHLVY